MKRLHFALIGILAITIVASYIVYAQESVWIQTTKADFDAGVLNNVDTTTTPSSVQLSRSQEIIDFEAPTYSLGNLNGQDGWSGSTYFQVQNSIVQAGGQAVSVNAPAYTPYTISKNIDTIPIGGSITFYMRKAGTASYYYALVAFLDGGTWIGYVQMYNKIDCQGGILITNPDGSSWYKFKIIFKNSNTITIEINDVSYGDYATSAAYSKVDKIMLYDDGGEADYDSFTMMGGGVGFASSGTIASQVFDSGFSGTQWKQLSWNETINEYEQSFDGLNDGDLNGQDGWVADTTPANVVTVQSTTKRYGAKAAKMSWTYAGPQDKNAYRTFTASTAVTVEFFTRLDAGWINYAYLKRGGTVIAALSNYALSNVFMRYTSGGWVDFGSASYNTWYKFKIVVHSDSTVDYYIYDTNDVLLHSFLGDSIPAVGTGIDTLQFQAHTSANYPTSTSYWDEVKYRPETTQDITFKARASDTAFTKDATTPAWTDAGGTSPVNLSAIYKKAITINNPGTTTLTNYQVLVAVDTASLISAGKMRSDCGDVRFKDAAGVELPYWLESGCNGAATKIWVKVPYVPSDSSTIYMYYGNPSAVNQSNSTNTFDFFDDFSATLDWTNKWQSSNHGLYSVSGGILYVSPIAAVAEILNKQNTVTNFIADARISFSAGAGGIYIISESAIGAWTGQEASCAYVLDAYATIGGSYNRVYTTTADTWYRSELKIPSNGTATSTLYSDDKQTTVVTYNATPTYIPSSYLGIFQAAAGTGYLDWFRVRKYASPEPSMSLGAEEPASPTGRYFQWQANLSTTDTSVTPILHEVNATYSIAAPTDTTPPTLTITSPTNTTYYTSSVALTFSATDSSGISWTGYSLDGAANVTSENTTLTALSEGTHYITVWANDTKGNMASSTVYFSISLVTLPAPVPQLVSVNYPSEAIANQSFTLTIKANNTGGNSPEGYISVSFPQITDIGNVSIISTTTPNSAILRTGDTIFDKNGNQIAATYSLVDAWDGNWSTGEEHTLQLSVTPPVGGIFPIYVRLAMKNTSTADVIRLPTTSSYTDQQGYYANRYTVNVTGPRLCNFLCSTPDANGDGICDFSLSSSYLEVSGLSTGDIDTCDIKWDVNITDYSSGRKISILTSVGIRNATESTPDALMNINSSQMTSSGSSVTISNLKLKNQTTGEILKVGANLNLEISGRELLKKTDLYSTDGSRRDLQVLDIFGDPFNKSYLMSESGLITNEGSFAVFYSKGDRSALISSAPSWTGTINESWAAVGDTPQFGIATKEPHTLWAAALLAGDINSVYSAFADKAQLSKSYESWFVLGDWQKVRDKYLDINGLKPKIPDLTISDLTLSPKIPLAGQNISVIAEISNIGGLKADNIQVEFMVDNSSKNIKTISFLGAGASTTVNFFWTVEIGQHNLTIKVDPQNLITEINEYNNEARLEVGKVFSIGRTAPIGASTIVIERPIVTIDRLGRVSTAYLRIVIW